jgi:hypothetical protein
VLLSTKELVVDVTEGSESKEQEQEQEKYPGQGGRPRARLPRAGARGCQAPDLSVARPPYVWLELS